jgi:hypothetical protein
LHRAARDDEDELGLNTVFAKNTLLLGNPEWRNIVADGTVGDQELRGLCCKGVGADQGAQITDKHH